MKAIQIIAAAILVFATTMVTVTLLYRWSAWYLNVTDLRESVTVAVLIALLATACYTLIAAASSKAFKDE